MGSQSAAITIASIIRATCSFDAKISSASTKTFELNHYSKGNKNFSQFSDFFLDISLTKDVIFCDLFFATSVDILPAIFFAIVPGRAENRVICTMSG